MKYFDPLEFAKSLIYKSMKLKKGDMVWIESGDYNLELAETIAVELKKMGAFPIIQATTDRYTLKMMEESPLEHLGMPRNKEALMKSIIDAFIYLEPSEDPATWAEIDPVKNAAWQMSRMPINRIYREKGVKLCLVLTPTDKMAFAYGVKPEYYHRRVWSAAMTPPEELYKRGKAFKEFMKDGDRVRITTEKGTDLSFSIRDRGIIICNGEELEENYETCRFNLNIPGGEVFTTMVEDTTEGVAVFDKVFIDGELVRDLKLFFKKGKVVDYDARSGVEYFKGMYETFTPQDKVAAEFGIGINPRIKKVIGCLSTDEKIAGTIHIAIGDNASYGGQNEAPVHFDMIMSKPDVYIDGRLMMKRGKPVLQENIIIGKQTLGNWDKSPAAVEILPIPGFRPMINL